MYRCCSHVHVYADVYMCRDGALFIQSFISHEEVDTCARVTRSDVLADVYKRQPPGAEPRSCTVTFINVYRTFINIYRTFINIMGAAFDVYKHPVTFINID